MVCTAPCQKTLPNMPCIPYSHICTVFRPALPDDPSCCRHTARGDPRVTPPLLTPHRSRGSKSQTTTLDTPALPMSQPCRHHCTAFVNTHIGKACAGARYISYGTCSTCHTWQPDLGCCSEETHTHVMPQHPSEISSQPLGQPYPRL